MRPRRALPIALLLAAALIPAAAAQDAMPTPVVRVATLGDPVQPLNETATTTATVTISCQAFAQSGNASEDGRTFTLDLRAQDAPAWARITVSPASMSIDPNACAVELGALTREATLVITTSADAPAFAPTGVTLVATLTAPEGASSTGSDQFVLEAGYFGILQAQAEVTDKMGKPQSQLVYPVQLTNLGNGPTKVVFRILNVTGGIRVVEPASLTLQSRQTGGERNHMTAQIMLMLPYRNGYVNEVSSVTFEVASHYALDDRLKGDTATITLLATTKGTYVPTPALPLLAGVALGAAIALRRR